LLELNVVVNYAYYEPAYCEVVESCSDCSNTRATHENGMGTNIRQEFLLRDAMRNRGLCCPSVRSGW